MTPSKVALLVVCCLSACAAFAATPQEAFANVREVVLRDGVGRAEGFRFAMGRAQPASPSTGSRHAAKRESQQIAVGNLVSSVVVETVDWPTTLPLGNTEILKNILAQIVGVQVQVSGLTTVYSEREGDVWVCVVALPEGEAGKVPRVSFEEARQMLLQEGVVSRAEGKALDALIALRGTLGKMPAAVERGPWEELLAAAEFGTPRLAALPRLAGRYPLGSAETPADADFTRGNEAFGKGDLEAAYAAFLASAGRAWTFDALNMAGNVARRLPGHEAEAVALLLHAAYLKPSSPYPWVHLAFVASREGDPALAEACCAKAETLGTGDAWVREQVAAVRKTLAPPASTQDASSRDAKVEQEAHP